MIYDGWKNGLPQFAVTDDQGRTKFVMHCKACKATSYVWAKSHAYMGHGMQVIDYKDQDSLVKAHQCGPIQAFMARHWKAHDLITFTVFHWVKRSDGGHKCNGRCMSATGPSCECQCQGRNHGHAA